jgi:hypothetical protein
MVYLPEHFVIEVTDKPEIDGIISARTDRCEERESLEKKTYVVQVSRSDKSQGNLSR